LVVSSSETLFPEHTLVRRIFNRGQIAMLTHVVLMKFTDPADATEAKARLDALVGAVPPILTMVVELDTLHTETSYDLLMTTTHTDADALRAYQSHPTHLDLAAWLRPRLAARAVVDY
jgi:hypothetical protein